MRQDEKEVCAAMKKRTRVRTGFLIFLGILTVICGCLFSLSVNLHDIVTETIDRSDVSGAMTEKLFDEMFESLGIEDEGMLADVRNYMKESEELSQITDKLIREMLACLEKGREYQPLELSSELDELIQGLAQHLGTSDSDLIEALKNEVIRQLRSKEAAIETVINQYAAQMLDRIQNASGTAGLAVKAYSLLQSVWFQIGLAAALVILVVLSFALSGRFGRGCLYLGVESIVCALLLLFVVQPVGSRLLARAAENFLGSGLELYMQPLETTGRGILAAGAVLTVIGLIGKFRSRKAAIRDLQ